MPCSLEHCKGLQREHALLAVFLVLKAGALISYVTRQRRLAARSAASVCVLPVYSRLLQYEALHSCLWAATFGFQAYVDGAGARDAVQTALLTTQYLTAASWVLCSEGLLLFLAGRGAGLAALRLATRAAAAWAILLTAGCGCALLAWAIRVPQPSSQPLQLLFAAAWAPYWSRLCVNIVAYPAAAAALGILRPKPAWERAFLLPKLCSGVASAWRLDAAVMPISFAAHAPLLRDSAYWARSGFAACVVGGEDAKAHRPSDLRIERPIGRGSSAVVSAASYFGEPVAVKQFAVAHLTRDFVAMFLTEAECLAHCAHPNVVRFVGGCVAPPLVCLPLNLLLRGGEVKICDFGSSRLLGRRAAASGEGGEEAGEAASLSEEVGTLPYMAPELFLGVVPSASADIFSFGVCVWELCSRLYPWRALLEAGRVDELRARASNRATRSVAAAGGGCDPPPWLESMESGRAPLQELTPPPALAWPWLETWQEDDWLAQALSTMAAVAVALFLLYAGSRTRWRSPVSPRGLLALLATAVRLLVPGGWRRRGVLSSLTFPALIEQLTPASLEAMLRHGAPGLLPVGARVESVHALQSGGFDGVKGDKHIVAVSYSGAGAAALPPRLFVKLSARGEFAMKMLAAATQTAACEALFYLRLAAEARECGIASPRCYFADFSSAGESCLLLEPLYDEVNLPRTAIAQLLGLAGLRHSARRTVGGRALNAAFCTWDVPAQLVGLELELIADLPDLLSGLCAEGDLLAYGHNDIVADNAFFFARASGGPEGEGATLGLFDWQQACLNCVGLEWAWNFHWLPPAFLAAHEADLLDLLLKTYAARGVSVPRDRFLRAYATAAASMYVFGGGAIQPLLKRLHRHGLLEDLAPDDHRHAGAFLHSPHREALLAAEMTRRTLTNACAIMRRHGFAEHWRESRARACVP
ncbi:hypothetical protein EMIHUDRAFT_458366 [Emiliania huxleyi CCMP1516]|uniref:Protein kinase domain-containing protein n=2 Tax=Emiliania huxleyi TaxID=2903 RepID=A0A0D3JD51_EMIH1|nr:hypothetical protein EMIHUDRAFT_458366 [Emiliania huxleyi CCMP1516]EOD21436.1 hypothetical protein EMIHUDRAFT_458366 [Emiliania huxleyi CCMP1516]|eukprot:XP_005773865.1 hypothetical protein EMIHUDRAFT_458366 [Emiliania huxleyi CCMP1516]